MNRHFRRQGRCVSVLVVYVSSAESLIDMLRYDRCCPATEDESRKIWALMGHQDKPADHVLRLHRFAGTEQPATDGRWRSFGCRVLDERSPEAEQLTDDEILNLAKVTA